MISQENFDALFDVLLEILAVKSPYSPQARAAYHRAVSAKLSDEEWCNACNAVIDADTYMPAPSRMIELGRMSRPQPLALPADRSEKSRFERLNPKEQEDYLAAIARARAIVLAAVAKAPKRVAGFGTVGETLGEWTDF